MFLEQNDRWLRREEKRQKKTEERERARRDHSWEGSLCTEDIAYFGRMVDLGFTPPKAGM